MIEKKFDVPFIADLALREKQIQQNYRPVIAVHKWFARRPGTLFRGLLLSEFSEGPLADAFYQANDLSGRTIGDPFMGGGTPLLEANRVGCDILGFDINPMSYWIVKQEIEHLDLKAYDRQAACLRALLEKEIGSYYRTRCEICGTDEAHVKYFLWVKTTPCLSCGQDVDLFPGYLVASDVRHPKNVFVCRSCGGLNETENRKEPGRCCHCNDILMVDGPAKRNKCECPYCGRITPYPLSEKGPPAHRLFAMEYHCFSCKKSGRSGRFFKRPDQRDVLNVELAETRWKEIETRFVPDDIIPTGDETNRLHRWGYDRYRDMFNARQLLGLELSARYISNISDERVKNALSTNLSDLLRYQNMLCRYDSMALKSLDIFSVHGFPVGLIQCESNFLGIIEPSKKTCIGSGGWINITEKFHKAKLYCDQPFEVSHQKGRKEIIPIHGEWIGDKMNGYGGLGQRTVNLHCGNSSEVELEPFSLDAVFTDPPYFGNVQYAELMDFCYVWLRKLVGQDSDAFISPSTRNPSELTVNEDMGRGLLHFTQGLSSVFQRMSLALKPGSPFAFTYHHNSIRAYYPAAVAILDAGLTCSASIPCPAEMGASIHIKGTGSSIIDTIFVCRTTGIMSRKSIADSPVGIARLVTSDLADLRQGNVKPTLGDIRCISYGHLVRLAIWNLRSTWDKTQNTSNKIKAISAWVENIGGWTEIEKILSDDKGLGRQETCCTVCENVETFGVDDDIPF